MDCPGLFDSHSNNTTDPIIVDSALNTISDQTAYDNTILTPPCKQQNRLAKRNTTVHSRLICLENLK